MTDEPVTPSDVLDAILNLFNTYHLLCRQRCRETRLDDVLALVKDAARRAAHHGDYFAQIIESDLPGDAP